jgi:RNA polymerase sigma factor (sigma-70 family)
LRIDINDTIAFLPALHRGESAAFETIYQQWVDPLCSFVEQIVGDLQAAEDIAVEAFTSTFKKHQDFITVEKLKAYLYITASNASVDFLRAKKKRKEAYEQIRYLSQTQKEDIELAYIQAEALRGIREAVLAVPGQAGEVLRKIFLEGKTLPETATELNIAYNTVQNHRTRGLQLVREHLAKKGALSLAAYTVAIALLELH